MDDPFSLGASDRRWHCDPDQQSAKLAFFCINTGRLSSMARIWQDWNGKDKFGTKNCLGPHRTDIVFLVMAGFKAGTGTGKRAAQVRSHVCGLPVFATCSNRFICGFAISPYMVHQPGLFVYIVSFPDSFGLAGVFSFDTCSDVDVVGAFSS